ncbi:hypothetical protein IscW_ISCW009488 [Ixodes scapularis]|uniref:Uncharacterized protein n=1 Tax=Ixodes scapularis TaxID=6945 RepID=B7PYX5_IXOSC|nr:hypothetical protein IscW_ISCW009488 [Ixodes scapularis]|eukprot:XP_002404231.1 hypothetical protein IscW_ISCW009488 [Ixodes scapularis]
MAERKGASCAGWSRKETTRVRVLRQYDSAERLWNRLVLQWRRQQLVRETGGVSALDFLASYCVNGAHADDLFCQVDPKINDATCGTPIVLQVLAPQPDGTMPTFSKLLVDQFVCIVSFQSPDISEGIYKGIACYLGQVLQETDLTGYAVRDQVEIVKSQLLTVGGCSA